MSTGVSWCVRVGFIFCTTAGDESLMEVGLTHEPALLWI